MAFSPSHQKRPAKLVVTYEASVSLDYVLRGMSLSSKFEVKGEDGLRIVPSTFIIGNQLKVSRISTLLGDSLSGTLVKAIH
jgi:hypothetical protein